MRCAYLLVLGLLLPMMKEAESVECGLGFKQRKQSCQDYNECQDVSSYCGNNADCYNTIGSYYCQCKPGFHEQSGKTNFTSGKGCKEINKCLDQICGPNSMCFKRIGTYYQCECKKGFLSSNGHKMFSPNQGVTCNELNYGFLKENSSLQISPELEALMKKLRNSCCPLSKEDSDVSGKVERMDLLKELLEALDRLLSAGSLTNNRHMTGLFEVVENVLKLAGPLLSNETRSSNQTEVNVLVSRSETPPQGPLSLSTSNTQFDSHWEMAAGDSYPGFTAASLLSYKTLECSLNNFFNHIKLEKKNEKFMINSKAVTISVTNPDTAQLKKDVNLTFSHLQPVNEKRKTICVFWNTTLDGGAWSTEGCKVVTSDANHTVCSCNHLSSFAVLMALYEREDVFELQLITWVGLSLSIICLLICILTFRFIRSIQSTRTTIHLYLCVSLFIANIIFLAGISQTENKVGCAFVAGLLHFFYLAAFCWMCLEGVQLFRMVVLVFNTTLRPLYLMAGGYGIPAIIVATSAIVNAKGYGTKRHCWLNLTDGFIWSFFGPVCVIIVVNIIFFLITVWKLAEKFSSLNQDLSQLHKIKSFIITSIAQLCVLGTMWIFGCFQFEEQSLVIDYLFTILNSLQGVLMFIMHCLLPKQVRDEYVKFLTSMCSPQKKKYSEFSTSQCSKSQGSGSVHDTRESHM